MAVKTEEPVVIRNLLDVKRAIRNFSVGVTGKSKISTTVEYMEDGKKITELVEAEVSNTSPRAMLIEGLELVKKRIEFQKVSKEAEEQTESSYWKATNFFDIDVNQTFFWVDSLIKNRLGGIRHDLCIRWTVPEGVHEWDPISGELKKVDAQVKA